MYSKCNATLGFFRPAIRIEGLGLTDQERANFIQASIQSARRDGTLKILGVAKLKSEPGAQDILKDKEGKPILVKSLDEEIAELEGQLTPEEEEKKEGIFAKWPWLKWTLGGVGILALGAAIAGAARGK